MTSMKYAWQGSMVLFIAVGAWLSARFSGAGRARYSPIWRRTVGIESLPQRLAMGFLGGFLMLFGARWAGACPGTVLAQIGAGYKDAWSILAGGILGAVAHGYAQPVLAPWSFGPGKITLAEVLGVPFWIPALGGAALMALCLLGLERRRSWAQELGPGYDGYHEEGGH